MRPPMLFFYVLPFNVLSCLLFSQFRDFVLPGDSAFMISSDFL